MPIYAYKCGACGHAKDVLQKISDAPLTVCPECGAASFSKQVTAAGFQLKGSGWYVTDFRNNGNGASGTAGAAKTEAKGESAGGDTAAKPGDAGAAKSADTGSAGAPTPAATPAAAPAASAS